MDLKYYAGSKKLVFTGEKDELGKLGKLYTVYIQNTQMKRGDNRPGDENKKALDRTPQNSRKILLMGVSELHTSMS